MSKEELRKEIEVLVSFYSGRSGWAFDKIQKILDKKAKGDLSIDLDIQMKIYNQVHSDSVKAFNFMETLKELLDKEEVRP